MTELPPIIEEIAEVAGLPAALSLSGARAGTSVYIPDIRSLSAGHWLVQTVGQTAAEAISERFSGEKIVIPLAGRGVIARARQAVRAALLDGATSAEAALLAGVTDRTVRRIKNGYTGRSDHQQSSLFD